jgi:hypothetical protein
MHSASTSQYVYVLQVSHVAAPLGGSAAAVHHGACCTQHRLNGNVTLQCVCCRCPTLQRRWVAVLLLSLPSLVRFAAHAPSINAALCLLEVPDVETLLLHPAMYAPSINVAMCVLQVPHVAALLGGSAAAVAAEAGGVAPERAKEVLQQVLATRKQVRQSAWQTEQPATMQGRALQRCLKFACSLLSQQSSCADMAALHAKAEEEG